jgi:ABC-2 type transport system permease protein
MMSSLVIAKKEIKTALRGPGFSFILFLFTLLISFVSYSAIEMLKLKTEGAAMQGQDGTVNFHSGYVAQLVYLMHFMMMLFIPALTAFSFAEERKSRTMDLLLTSPITSTEIVMGKFKAIVAMILLLLGISLIYPASLSLAVDVDWKLLASSYVGMFLVANVYISIGLFSSSLTSSVILSYVISVVLNLFCIFIVWGTQTSENPIVRDVLNHVSISKHLTDFIQGSVHLSSFVFLITVVIFFMFMTQRVIESARWR